MAADTFQSIRLPRIQFITDDSMMNYNFAGPINSLYQAVQVIPYRHRINSFVHDYANAFQLNITDSFGRRWQGDGDNIPLENWSLYPGAGNKYYPKIDRYLTDPMLDTNRDVDIPSDTNLTFNFTKVIPNPQILNCAIMCECPWESRYAQFPSELSDERWWQDWKVRRIPYRATVSTNENNNGLNGTNLRTTAALQVTGDVLVNGITYTGGADITANIRNSQQSNPAGFITTQPVRIDLLGPCRLNPGAYNPQEFRWPGVYYVKRGMDLLFDLASLAGPGVPINQLITVTGWVLDWGRY